MRKILSFGLGKAFLEGYSALLERNGFELEVFRPNDPVMDVRSGAPVILATDCDLRPADHKGLLAALSSQKKPRLIIVSSCDRPGMSEDAKKLRKKASVVLGPGFLKKDLVGALKAVDEVLTLQEKSAALKEELDMKSRYLTCLLDVTKMLSSTLDFSKAVNRIMERTRSMVGAEGWAVFLVDIENNSLVFSAAKGVPGTRDVRFRLAPGEGIAGWAMEDMEPKVVQDVSREPRFTKAVDRVTGVRSRSVMAVPISAKGRLLGVAELINKGAPEGFTKEDLKLVMMLMDQTALAVERSELYQRMEDLAITDDLTKLFNLRYLDRTLDIEIERSTRYNLSVSLIFMDIDFFKNVNDRFGHLVGSKLLVEISQLLLKGLRKIDIVARYGGDEFVIVLPQTGVSAAKMIANRLRKSIERHTFLKSENLGINLTASFGIAAYPEHAATREDLLRLADEAMYRVKYQTRNDVYVVDVG